MIFLKFYQIKNVQNIYITKYNFHYKTQYEDQKPVEAVEISEQKKKKILYLQFLLGLQANFIYKIFFQNFYFSFCRRQINFSTKTELSISE